MQPQERILNHLLGSTAEASIRYPKSWWRCCSN
jgi:hypothetical protein